ncbi:MAG TPA: serine hydrolase [Solirubrobacterales bacterium]|nr:serine hydrolase [Solirubrobacterales bacterium]
MAGRASLIAATLAIGLALAVPSIALGAPRAKGPKGPSWSKRLREADRFIRGRIGTVSFAVVDERGRVHGRRRSVHHKSASLAKAMILVAYLRRGDVRGRRLRAYEKALLAPMIRVSDNDAANDLYNRVGPERLARLAKRAGMRRFVASPVWGGCQVTARDQARFFFRIRGLIPRRHRDYALRLLSSIVRSQRWGIPRVIPAGWRIHFKGGWTPDDDGWRVHQAALVRGDGRRISIAVLTGGNPGLGYGARTIAGVAARLLRGYRPAVSSANW